MGLFNRKAYSHPVTEQEVKTYSCMECGDPVEYQFGVCGSCVAKISEREARERVQDAKATYEREQWLEERRARRGR